MGKASSAGLKKVRGWGHGFLVSTSGHQQKQDVILHVFNNEPRFIHLTLVLRKNCENVLQRKLQSRKGSAQYNMQYSERYFVFLLDTKVSTHRDHRLGSPKGTS